MLADEVHRGRVLRRPDGRFVLVPGKFPPGVLAALRGLPGPEVVVRAYAGATACRGRRVKTATPPRVALRWPEEVAEALGVSRSWLYESGLAAELSFWRKGKVRLVLVRELERAVERLSARWDE